jgi:PHD/YefM family antitoxin component YafN of YafNO toxin-antitoxin module
VVTLVLRQHEATVLDPAEAFDLLDFLFAYRDLLAAQSAELAERRAETPKEEK